MTRSPKRIVRMDEALKSIEQSVAEYGPEWIDPQAALIKEIGHATLETACKYSYKDADDQTRRCLVGQGLHILGFNVERAVARAEIPGESNTFILDEIERPYETMFTAAAHAVMLTAQQGQDSGETWAKAFQYANERAEAIRSGTAHVWYDDSTGDLYDETDLDEIVGYELFYNDDTEPSLVPFDT